MVQVVISSRTLFAKRHLMKSLMSVAERVTEWQHTLTPSVGKNTGGLSQWAEHYSPSSRPGHPRHAANLQARRPSRGKRVCRQVTVSPCAYT